MASKREIDLRESADRYGLNLTDRQIERLARGEVLQLDEAPKVQAEKAKGEDCCGDGYVGFGHHPRWCVQVSWPPSIKVCWG